MDPLLAGDGTDLEPDTDAAPVKIDESGQVVGLSGLTELMRQNDAERAKADARARSKAAEPPPTARITRQAPARTPKHKPEKPPPSKPSKSSKPSKTKEKTTEPTITARERAQQRARQRKLQTTLIIASAAACVVVMLLVLIVVLGSENGDDTQSQTNLNASPADNNNPRQTQREQNNQPGPIELFPPDPDDPDPQVTNPNQPSLFGVGNNYSENPEPRYTPRTDRQRDRPPAEVPAVLIQAQLLTHEGWYILTPPRGAIDAAGTAGDVELSALTKAYTTQQGTTILSATLTNRGERAVVAGQAHLALLDPAGRVFAETYLPFALLAAGETREVRLGIPQRFWDRCRDHRTRAIVLSDAPSLTHLNEVQLAPVGQGPNTAVRVSVRNPRDQWLGDAVLVLTATDLDGHPVARFRLTQQDLLIAPGQWLDMVVHTPLPDTGPAIIQWQATLHAPAAD
ncbi:MAG: hypothetical protein AAGC44_09635 [Planctomycetota bacterium]